MADFSTLNGFNVKDKVGREQINILSQNFNNFKDITNSGISTLTSIINDSNTDNNNKIENLNDKINNLLSCGPLKANSISEMTDHNKIYVLTTDGKWYYYDNEWVAGGDYQGTTNTDIIKHLTDYEKFNYNNINDLDTEILYNIERGKQYKIILINSDLTYTNNRTSLCLQYYDENKSKYIDFIRKTNNYESNENIIYFNNNFSINKIRLVAHSTTSANLTLIIESLEEIYTTNFKEDIKNDYIYYPIIKDKTYLFKIKFNNYNSDFTPTVNQNNTEIIKVSGSSDQNGTVLEEYFKIIKKRNINLDNDTFYISFTSKNNYEYLKIYTELIADNYDSVSVYDITNTDEGNLHLKDSLYNENINNSQVENFTDNSKLPVIFKDNISFSFGNITKQGDESTASQNSLRTTEKIKFLYNKLLIEIDPLISRYKLTEYDENKNFISNTDFITENRTFNINTNHYYKLVWAFQDVEANQITFNSPIENGYLKLYYINEENDNNSDRISTLELYNQALFNTPNSIKTPRLYAHRGYQEEAPENSIPAFRLAGEYGFWGIETDLYKTSDDVIVCMHDSTIDRTTNGTGSIDDMTYNEISQYRIDTGNNIESYTDNELKIPTIDDYLTICRYYGMVPYIELKTNIISEVIQKLKDYGIEKRAIISSSSWSIIANTRKISNVYIHWIHQDTTYEHVEDLSALGNAGRSFDYQNLDSVPENFNKEMNSYNIGYCFRAADTIENVKKQINLGLTYIPTNKIKPSDLI